MLTSMAAHHPLFWAVNAKNCITFGRRCVIPIEMTTETYIEMATQQRKSLLRLAKDFLHNEAEAEDVVQESLLI